MKLPYTEGSVFLVPLRNGGYARGLVARSNSKGKVLLGYFFGPRLSSIDSCDVNDLTPADNVLCVRFGDLGLINGTWKICGSCAFWDREKCPMPDFVRRDDLSQRAWLVRYSDEDPSAVLSEHPTDFDSKLSSDALLGYGAVEIALTKALGEPHMVANS